MLVQVVCASRRRDVVDRAVQAGADDAVFLPRDDTVSQLVDATTMSGYNRIDVSFDLVGDGSSLAVALRSLHRGGALFELGAPSAADDDAPSLEEVTRRGVTVRPVSAGSLAQLRQLVDLLAVQHLTVDVPIERYRPDQLATAVERLEKRLTNGRIVIEYD